MDGLLSIMNGTCRWPFNKTIVSENPDTAPTSSTKYVQRTLQSINHHNHPTIKTVHYCREEVSCILCLISVVQYSAECSTVQNIEQYRIYSNAECRVNMCRTECSAILQYYSTVQYLDMAGTPPVDRG